MTAIVDDWTSTHASLAAVEPRRRREAGPIRDAWPAVIGKAGAAWGDGLHGSGAPPAAGPAQARGRSREPAGAFAIRDAYGYAAAAGAQSRRREDEARLHRAHAVVAVRRRPEVVALRDRSSTAARSQRRLDVAETMRRDDGLYTWVVDVAHNPRASPARAAASSCTSGAAPSPRPWAAPRWPSRSSRS